MTPENSVLVLFYTGVAALVVVVAAVARLWQRKKLTGEQWDKIGTRVEASLLLGVMALGAAVTLYYHFVN
ncbi:MAG: hypothetical protein JWP22_3208 [Ramlibacter sp.]|nr:hypothetical protein [Ramlibacter sp.]MDB5914533.1 hypothetical protein [Ramlibacter sp.]